MWRLHLAEHLYRQHRSDVWGEVRDWCEDAFSGVELRTLQRELLVYALDHPSFTVEAGGDSTSLHSMERRGWFAADAKDAELRERTWSLTPLGQAVARGALQRQRELAQRARHPAPAPNVLTAWTRSEGHRRAVC